MELSSSLLQLLWQVRRHHDRVVLSLGGSDPRLSDTEVLQVQPVHDVIADLRDSDGRCPDGLQDVMQACVTLLLLRQVCDWRLSITTQLSDVKTMVNAEVD